jgi:N-methylhydantoinase A
MRLDLAAARNALEGLAHALGQTVESTALGITRIANEHMARALRVISIQRGLDPRGFTLVSFGGAGGLHVCALAGALGMSSALVPVQAGVLSALGMLVARPGRQRLRTRLGLLSEFDEHQLQQELEQLAEGGIQALAQEGQLRDGIVSDYSLDLRYQGQSYTLNLPWRGSRASEAAFHQLHEASYGHRMDSPVELVNLRVALVADVPQIELGSLPSRRAAAPREAVELFALPGLVPRYERNELAAEQQIEGPALITETVSTTWIEPGWSCRVDPTGNLLLQRA